MLLLQSITTIDNLKNSELSTDLKHHIDLGVTTLVSKQLHLPSYRYFCGWHIRQVRSEVPVC